MEPRHIVEIDIDNIIPNPYQPRKTFTQSSLQELSDSIKTYGILQPITVRKIGEKFELVAGERRYRASKMAGLKTIPAIVTNMTDESSAVLALIENLQREDLNFIEESEGYYNLIKDYGFTQQQLAEKLGKNQSTIANKLRILRLSEEIKAKLLEHNLTERHARALLKLPDDTLRMQVLDAIIKNDLTVKKTEKLIKDMLDEILNKKEPPKKQTIKASLNLKIYLNTLKSAYKAIIDTGVKANYKEIDKGDHVEVVVRIPKG
ncbi:chromosome partitioning protein, ParB family [Alkalithermobacter thermoalcaliphilus JW-YL-7 = DSM 7308]|uniref:Chromosome partitioning protein, ParB family n=1 Tax=Alkalithermobacter thermoalcaliphilus JW-YL-7 = DSM 7308 TaxID=1121328 RepID=A0A150FT08_CLOPD|nr:parB-like partition protein [[Clostridium] paradoxum JW-YL-7 = DSM 7308]SHL08780.1 chromosome partitioning protein, ParB family [[Clostridium] paradoxum JW-YL-7 = DSM 7308]